MVFKYFLLFLQTCYSSFVELFIKYNLFTMNKIVVEGENRKEKSSFVDGANDRGAYPKRWVAALVQVNCEKIGGFRNC